MDVSIEVSTKHSKAAGWAPYWMIWNWMLDFAIGWWLSTAALGELVNAHDSRVIWMSRRNKKFDEMRNSLNCFNDFGWFASEMREREREPNIGDNKFYVETFSSPATFFLFFALPTFQLLQLIKIITVSRWSSFAISSRPSSWNQAQKTFLMRKPISAIFISVSHFSSFVLSMPSVEAFNIKPEKERKL
jgi:hypothetical protein